jgi:hypothetical protein
VSARDLFSFPRVLLPFAGIAGSYLVSRLALQLYDRFPTFNSVACGESGASGCLEWGFLFIGPFYLIAYLLLVAGLFVVVLGPFAMSLALWLRPLKKKDPIETNEQDSNQTITVWGAIKEIYTRSDPNA